eukprot:TRINITY_DN5138_c0_g1_i1.p1 TRINITY_DN5138_c0_g1~~TRINITY_DN5138_c0_g1_i1.p1  ORF type:complete len:775 (-),score=169.60 TRINITY_DN5138_c0_g1_i1:7-2331(-)
MVNFEPFLSVLALNVIVALVVFFLFWALRSLKSLRYFYAPLYHDAIRIFGADPATSALSVNTPRIHDINPYPGMPGVYSHLSAATYNVPSPGHGPFSWIYATLSFSEDQLLAARGLDVVMYLRTLRLMIIICCVLMVPCIGILLPLNYTGDSEFEQYNGNGTNWNPEHGNNPWSNIGTYNSTALENGLGMLTIANIVDGSMRLWAHLLTSIGATAVCFLLMYKEYSRYSHLRIRYNQQQRPHNYAVMVKGVPAFITTPAQLRDFFVRAHPGRVVDTHMPLKDKTLRELQKRKYRALQRLEHFRALIHRNQGSSITHLFLKQHKGKKKGYMALESHEEAVAHYEEKIAKLDIKIREEKVKHDKRIGSSHSADGYGPVGFVVFNSIAAASQCAQSLIYSNLRQLRLRQAPEPDDIHWSLVTKNTKNRFSLLLMCYFVFGILILFWFIPVTFAQALANLSALASFEGLSWFISVIEFNPIVGNLVQGFLPALVLIIFQQLLPLIIKIILRLKGVYTRSQLEKEVLYVFHVFQVVNVLLFSTALRTLVKVIGPHVQIDVGGLALSVGAQSAFFINYLLVYGLSSIPKDLLRAGELFIRQVRRFHNRKEVLRSEQISREVDRPDIFEYGQRYANALLMFTISLCFCCVAPIILPCGVIAMSMEYVVAKYLLMYTSNQRFHSGGRFWPCVFNRMVVGVVMFQVLMFGLLTLKVFPPSLILVIMPIVAYIFARWSHKKYFKLSRHLASIDYPPEEDLEGTAEGGYDGEKFRYAYRDPGLMD